MAILWSKLQREDIQVITKIVEKAFNTLEIGSSKVDLTMDISATHIYNPLDLNRLLEAKEDDFAHDIYGIVSHIDRTTGKLKNFFTPRYSKRS